MSHLFVEKKCLDALVMFFSYCVYIVFHMFKPVFSLFPFST